MLIPQLQTIHDPQHLFCIPPYTSGIHHCKSNLLSRIDHENTPYRERNALFVDVGKVLGVDHVVEESDMTFGVGNDGEGEVCGGDFVDIGYPPGVGGEVVGGLDRGVGLALRVFLSQMNRMFTSPISLTFLFSNSSFSLANAPSSVVHTGVKSAGWLNRIAHLSPIHWWKSMSPWVVLAVKLGAVVPSRKRGCSFGRLDGAAKLRRKRGVLAHKNSRV